MAVVAPSSEDGFVRGLSQLIGGPFGRSATPRLHRRWILAVVLFVTYVVVILAWVQKAPCVTNPWANNYQYTHYCYSDVLALYYDEHLTTLKVPFLDNETPDASTPKYVEYPVLTGWYMFGAAGLAHAIERPTTSESTSIAGGGAAATQAQADLQTRQMRAYVAISAIGMGVAALVVALLVGLCAGRRRPWDAMMVAVSPVLLLYLNVNWDILATAAAVGTLVAWSRRRWWLAGFLLAIGVSAKLYPLLILIAIGLVALRHRQWRALASTIGAGVITWVVINVPVWIANPAGFEHFWSFNSSRGADIDSWTYAWQTFVFGANHFWSSSSLNLATTVLFVLCVVGIALLTYYARETPRIAQLAFLVIVAFLLTNKVYSPQYAIFLLPFAILARPRWPYFLLWQASEIVLFLTRYPLFINYSNSQEGLTYTQYFLIGILPRDVILLGLAGLVVKEILRPRDDVVRSAEETDPLDGLGPLEQVTGWTPQASMAT